MSLLPGPLARHWAGALSSRGAVELLNDLDGLGLASVGGAFLAVQGDTSITLSGLNLQPESHDMFGKGSVAARTPIFILPSSGCKKFLGGNLFDV